MLFSDTDLHNFFCCLGTYFETLLLPAKCVYLAAKIALKFVHFGAKFRNKCVNCSVKMTHCGVVASVGL